MTAFAFENERGEPACLWVPDDLTFDRFKAREGNALILSDTNIGYDGWRVFEAGRVRWPEDQRDDLAALSEPVLGAARMLLHGGEWFRPGSVAALVLPPGQFHPRVWRGRYRHGQLFGSFSEVDAPAEYAGTFHGSMVASGSLFAAVADLFRYVEPHPSNASAYGHRVRELLLLLCTEVEACWRGVLLANRGGGGSTRLTTRDYWRLLHPLHLDQWSVVLRNYAGFDAFTPFRGWIVHQPTVSLSWYDAYNSAKHDREGAFDSASLGHLLEAAAALHVMQVAQWGPQTYDRWHYGYESIFHTTSVPEFQRSELYFRAIPDKLGSGLTAGPVPLWP